MRKIIGVWVFLLSFFLLTPQSFAATRDYQSYATNTYNAMQKYLYSNNKLYKENYPSQSGDPRYSYNWPFYSAMAGTLDMYGLVGTTYSSAVTDRMTGLSRYWDSAPSYGLPGYDSYVIPPLGTGGDKYTDDNVISALNLVRVYRLTNNTTALSQAKADFNYIVSNWDTTSSCATGGLYWIQQTPTQTNHVRATNATSLGAELALRLYQITGQQTYLDWGNKMYNWVATNMYDSNDGMYWNSIDQNCSYDYAKWSYSQGAMIGANVLLAKITNDSSYITKAENLSTATLNYYGNTAGWWSQDPAFNAMYFKNSLMLYAVTTNTALQSSIMQAMQTYADGTWDNTSIHQSTNLFYFQPGHAWLLQQGAMVQIFAALKWPLAKYDLLF